MTSPADDLSPSRVPPVLLTAWGALWSNRLQPYALQQEDGTYRWVYAPCDASVLAAHLAGAATIALSSLAADGTCRWLCLDADEAGALPHLLEVAASLTERGLPALVEASRRGGHLWLLLDVPVAAAVVRRVVLAELEEVRTSGLMVPTLECYPEASAPGALGHAVRLPLGIHRLTGRRYPLFDEHGYPCVFRSTAAAIRLVLGWPRISSVQLARRAADLHHAEAGGAGRGPEQEPPEASHTPPPIPAPSASAKAAPGPLSVGTRSAVIRWVDAYVAIPELLAEIAPMTELKKVGRGYLGWCPFHDDRAPDAAGRPGTPSFYAVLDRRYGWSWRCFSTNCAHSSGPMRHSFRLLQDLLELTASQTIGEACGRWPEAETAKPSSEDKNGDHA